MAEQEQQDRIEVEHVALDRWRIRFRGNLMHVDSQALIDLADWIEVHRTSILMDLDQAQAEQPQEWQAQAIARYSELDKFIRAGAYDEREPDGSYGADGIEREYSELEYQANQRGLNFVWYQDILIYTLEPMSPEELAAFKAAQEEYY